MPQVLLDRLIRLFPDFAVYWNRAENCFRSDDGSFTYRGVFAEFSHYFRGHYEQLSQESIKGLAELLADCMRVKDSELGIAGATCFLENVAGERFSNEFRTYLVGEPLAYYSQW
jgi:hypothetical protein